MRRQEEELANREIELALRDARVRGRESQLSAQLSMLSDRAGWIESRVAEVRGWAQTHDIEPAQLELLDDALRGLGDGAALQEASLDGYVSRSQTLMVARAAMAAQRADVLRRRAAQLDDRDREVGLCEEALVRAEVRLAARERMVIEAIMRLEQFIGVSGIGVNPQPKRSDFATTVTMTCSEVAQQDAVTMHRPSGGKRQHRAPPVLDLSAMRETGNQRRQTTSRRRRRDTKR